MTWTEYRYLRSHLAHEESGSRGLGSKRISGGELGLNDPELPRGGTSRVEAAERRIDRGDNMDRVQILTFPLGPRREGKLRFKLTESIARRSGSE